MITKIRPWFISILLIIPLCQVLSVPMAGNVTWNEDIEQGLTITYEVTTVEGLGIFGDQHLNNNDKFNVSIVSAPPTVLSDLYTGEPRPWIDIYYQGSLMDKNSFSIVEIELLYAFFVPLAVTYENGTETDMFGFLSDFKPTMFSQTSVTTADSGFEYIMQWFNQSADFFSHAEIITDMDNGITNWITYEYNNPSAPEENNKFQFRHTGDWYVEEEEDDGGIDISLTSITWSEGITKDTILAWELETFEVINTSEYTIGGFNLNEGDKLQFAFVQTPPTDPKKWMVEDEPPEWINLLMNQDQIDLEDIGSEGNMLLIMALPIEYTLDNGTLLGLRDFYELYLGTNEDFHDFLITEVNGTNFNITFTESYEDSGKIVNTRYCIISTIESGITNSLSLNGNSVNMTWNYYEEAANIDPEATSKTMESDYSVSLDYPEDNLISPSFEFYSILVLLFSAMLWRKKKNT